MFEEIIKNGITKLGLEMTPVQLSALRQYCDFMLEYNEKVNLTAITDPEEAARKHFLDSLACSSLIPHGASCADIGTGAGFPGMVLAIARPDITVGLFDSLEKRLEFLRQLAARTGTDNVSFIHSRAEDAGTNPIYREKYQVVLSRALARTCVLAELTLPFAAVDGKVIALKGPAAEEELQQAERAIKLLGGGEGKILPSMAFDGQAHTLLVIPKTSHTPKGYPRKAGTPSKQPLL